MHPWNYQLRLSDAPLSSPDNAMQGPKFVGDLEQIENPAKPITPDYTLQGSNLSSDFEQLEDPARPLTLDYPLQGSDLACDL